MILPVAIATAVSLLALGGAQMARNRARGARAQARGGQRAPAPPRRQKKKKKKKKGRPSGKKRTTTKPMPTHTVEVRPGDAPPKPPKGKPLPPEVPEHRVKVVKSTPKPTTPKTPPRLKPRAAAARLFEFVNMMISAGNASQLGTKGKPNEDVRVLQRAMRKIKADGNYGPKTRRRGKELLGREFPPRKGKTVVFDTPPPAPPPPAPTRELQADLVVDTAPVQLAPIEVVDEGSRTPERAAHELLAYAKTGANLGSKGNKSEEVELAQRDMGGLTTDGIYGPKTRARGTELIHEPFPVRG